jgi:hypothetical protein
MIKRIPELRLAPASIRVYVEENFSLEKMVEQYANPAVRSVVGHPGRTTSGRVAAATRGTPLIQESVPRMPPSVDFNTVSVVWPLVAAFRLVYRLT